MISATSTTSYDGNESSNFNGTSNSSSFAMNSSSAITNTTSYDYESSNFSGTSITSVSATMNSSYVMNHTTSYGNESSNFPGTSNSSSSAMTSSLTGDELMKTSFVLPSNAKRPFLSMISAKPTTSYGNGSSNFHGTSNSSFSAITSSLIRDELMNISFVLRLTLRDRFY